MKVSVRVCKITKKVAGNIKVHVKSSSCFIQRQPGQIGCALDFETRGCKFELPRVCRAGFITL